MQRTRPPRDNTRLFSPLSIAPGHPTNPPPLGEARSGAMIFAAELERLRARLGSSDVALTLYDVRLGGIEPAAARELVEKAAGPCAFLTPLGPRHHAMVFIGRSRGLFYNTDMAVRLRALLRDSAVPDVQGDLRTLQIMSQDIVDGRFILMRLLRQAPARLWPAPSQ